MTITDLIMETFPLDKPIEATPLQAIPLETTSSETHQPEEPNNLVQPEHYFLQSDNYFLKFK